MIVDESSNSHRLSRTPGTRLNGHESAWKNAVCTSVERPVKSTSFREQLFNDSLKHLGKRLTRKDTREDELWKLPWIRNFVQYAVTLLRGHLAKRSPGNAVTRQRDHLATDWPGACHSNYSTHPLPMRCSPTLLSHAKGSRSLSFKIVPPPCEVFSYLVIACQGEQEPIIQNSPPTPTLWGVLLPCYRMPRGAGAYHSK